MTPPLISEYKKYFAVKRVCQTFLGGPRLLSSPPIYIIVQTTIFTLPAILVSVINLTELDYVEDTIKDTELEPDPKENVHRNLGFTWKALVVGLSLFLIDIALSLIIYILKRGHQVTPLDPPQTHFLNEEDQVEYEGCIKPSTWVFIAPNVTVGAMHFIAITVSSLSFALCTPLVIFETIPTALRGVGLFALCNARYSAVISLAPEIATFDAIRRKDILYRPFYTVIIGLAHFIVFKLCSDFYTPLPFAILLSSLPLLWGIGILPPLDALLSWLFEFVLRLIGGNPSIYYFGTVLSLIVAGAFTILVFVIGNQNYVLVLVLQCIFGYLISCDTGLILQSASWSCEDVPAGSILPSLFKPVATVLISILCVSLPIWVELTDHKLILMYAALCISLSSWALRRVLVVRRDLPPNCLQYFHLLWDGLITFVLHTWLSIEIKEMNSGSTIHTLTHLLEYLQSIRAFAVVVVSPKMAAIDMTVVTLYMEYSPELEIDAPKLNFTLGMILACVLRIMICRFVRYLNMIAIFSHAVFMSPLFNSNNKYNIAVISTLCSPLSMGSLILACVVDGATLTPVFTLPIFVVGFPRPASFWKERWFSKAKVKFPLPCYITTEAKGLDWTIYSQIGPAITRALIRKSSKARLNLEVGRCFVARCEDRLLFLRVAAAGWNYVYIHIKGLEMQEQTSCHHQEAAWMDELLENAFGVSKNRLAILTDTNTILTSVRPKMTLFVPSYLESKSILPRLTSINEKHIFQKMFYHAFSYLWIKSNPAFKGESYRNNYCPIASGYQFMPPPAISDNEGAYRSCENENLTNSANFSLNNALYSYGATNVNILRPSSVASGQAWAGDNSFNRNNEILQMPTEIPDSGSPFSSFSRNKSPSFSNNEVTHNNNIDSPSRRESTVSLPDSNYLLDTEWVKLCVGETIPSNAVRARVENVCLKAWNSIIGENGGEIDMEQFFNSEFKKIAEKLSSSKFRTNVNIEEITVKSFRYASKLALDEVHTSQATDTINAITTSPTVDVELFERLTEYEREYAFCEMEQIPGLIDARQKQILSMSKNDNGDTIMRMFTFVSDGGVEFRVGEIAQYVVEGIWGNLSLELLYLTSDDDERFSIQHDRNLMRNIVTQTANSPLGYPVYDAIFRVNQFDFTIDQLIS